MKRSLALVVFLLVLLLPETSSATLQRLPDPCETPYWQQRAIAVNNQVEIAQRILDFSFYSFLPILIIFSVFSHKRQKIKNNNFIFTLFSDYFYISLFIASALYYNYELLNIFFEISGFFDPTHYPANISKCTNITRPIEDVVLSYCAFNLLCVGVFFFSRKFFATSTFLGALYFYGLNISFFIIIKDIRLAYEDILLSRSLVENILLIGLPLLWLLCALRLPKRAASPKC